jgi:hypothetical protein
LLEQGTGGEAAAPYLIDGQNFDISPLLPLPNTRGQREVGAATVEFDQRVVVVVLEWLVEGFGGVSKEF